MRKHGGPDSASVRQAQIERNQSEEQCEAKSVSAAVREMLADRIRCLSTMSRL